jgi:hypothetical protein
VSGEIMFVCLFVRLFVCLFVLTSCFFSFLQSSNTPNKEMKLLKQCDKPAFENIRQRVRSTMLGVKTVWLLVVGCWLLLFVVCLFVCCLFVCLLHFHTHLYCRIVSGAQ